MKNTLVNLTRLFILAAIIGMASGCGVTKEELDSVRATAETALSEARAAKDEAAQASSAAQEVKSSADSAVACCEENKAAI
ncbi:MAG TPA: hypothetical protein VE735_08625, partial [Gammaproteobacteria bacterium]|nr:hypothetical protein [Gammaproteobacteria bacterium]